MTPRRGLVLVVLGASCWGAGGLSGALLASEAGLGAGAIAAYRLIGGGAVLLGGLAVVEALGPRRRFRLGSRAAWVRTGAVAALIAVFQAAYFEAVSQLGVAVATLVTLGSAPVIVASALAVRRRRLPAAHVLAAIVSAILGLVLLVLVDRRPGGPTAETQAALPPLGPGMAWALLAALAFAALVGVNRRAVPGVRPILVTGLAFVTGGAALLPWAALGGGLRLPGSGAGWGWLAFLAIVPTALAYALYFSGLPATGATRAALAALLEPLAAALLAVAFLGERLGPPGWLGAILLVLAVVLARPPLGRSPTMDLGPRATRGNRHAPARAGDEPWE